MMKLTARLSRPGATLAYTDTGVGGPAVVFTHGAGMDHTVFEAQVEAVVAAGYRAVVWDVRGHGASTLDADARFTAADALDDLAALLDECGLDRPVLVGHSLGGNLAQSLVRRDPGRTGGLVVLDATWNTGPLRTHERIALRLAAPMLRLVPARALPRLMARASAATPEAVARTEQIFAAMPRATFLDVWRATASLVAPDPGYRTPVPLALIRGALDRTGNIASAMPRWAAAEGVEEHVVPGAGHVVTLDAPAEASRVLLHVLRSWHPLPDHGDRS